MTDIAIIGAGVAGLSAATTAAIRNKTVLLFDDKTIGGKLNSTTDVKNFLGFFGKSQDQIQEELLNHIKALGLTVTEKKINSIFKMGDYFSLISGSEFFEAKTVILASGISFGKSLDGEEKFLGRGISYCATCDGMLYKNKTVAVIGYSPREEKEVDFLCEIVNQVFYFPQYPNCNYKNEKCKIIEGTKNFKIVGNLKTEKLVYDEKEIIIDCVFILRDNIPPAQLISGIEMDGNHIKVNRNMETNIPGFFAAGDITGTPYQFSKSSGEGNVASLSAIKFLSK